MDIQSVGKQKNGFRPDDQIQLFRSQASRLGNVTPQHTFGIVPAFQRFFHFLWNCRLDGGDVKRCTESNGACPLESITADCAKNDERQEYRPCLFSFPRFIEQDVDGDDDAAESEGSDNIEGLNERLEIVLAMRKEKPRKSGECNRADVLQ